MNVIESDDALTAEVILATATDEEWEEMANLVWNAPYVERAFKIAHLRDLIGWKLRYDSMMSYLERLTLDRTLEGHPSVGEPFASTRSADGRWPI